MIAVAPRVIVAVALLALAAAPVRAAASDETTLAEFASFVIGAPVDDETRGRLAEFAADEAKRDPAAAAKARAEFEKLMPKIRALETEPERATARGLIISALYWTTRQSRDPGAELILEKAGVVAVDPETRAVVRNADLEGFCRSARLAAEATGADYDAGACDRAARDAVAKLAAFPSADREMIAAGERRAAVLAEHWRSLDAPARERLMEIARKRAGSPDPVRLARPLETAALSARLDARLARFGDAAARGLAASATSSAIGAATRGF